MAKADCTTDIGIDMGKFICAVLILISHMGPFESYGSELNYWIVNLSFRFSFCAVDSFPMKFIKMEKSKNIFCGLFLCIYCGR